MPTNIARTVPPSFELTSGGQLNGASFGVTRVIDAVHYRTPNVPRAYFPAVLALASPHFNSEIIYTLKGKNPTSTSYLYTGSLVFRQNMSGTDNTVVKARIYDKSKSKVKTRIIRLEFRVMPVGGCKSDRTNRDGIVFALQKLDVLAVWQVNDAAILYQPN